jgi:hypothetical protein
MPVRFAVYDHEMSPEREPTRMTDPSLLDVLAVLINHEPIFHRPELGTTRADFENMMMADFWEVGASGRRYSRDYVLDTLEERYASQTLMSGKPGTSIANDWPQIFTCSPTPCSSTRSARPVDPRSGGIQTKAGKLSSIKGPWCKNPKRQFAASRALVQIGSHSGACLLLGPVIDKASPFAFC